MPISEEIRQKISDLPHKPGVYLMKDRFGRVIYVGKARSLRKRVSQYFHPSRRHGWDLKLNALVEAIATFDVHVVASESEALLLEGRLIKDLKPRYNVSFRDDKRFLLLKVNLSDPIPRFTFTRYRNDDQSRYFGPFAHSGAARRTLDRLRQKFALRGCRPLQPDADDYKRCLYGHIDVCSAPCVGKISLEDYKERVAQACAYLEERAGEMITELEEEMRQAAESLDFERAASLRDAIKDWKLATQQGTKYRRLPQNLPTALNPDRDLRELASWLELPHPPRRVDGFDISNISGTLAVASMVCFIEGKPERGRYRRFRIRDVEGQDDFACMAETVRRRYTRVKNQNPEAMPDLIVVDGGKGQLNAAHAELTKLGLETLPIIGLAKQFEEVFRIGHSEALRIPHDRGALQLLQRIRDESHRFANSYNAKLRAKRISESVLDEMPGLGFKRKTELLKQFGTIHNIRDASLDQLTQTPGIGEKTAIAIQTFLKGRLRG